MSPRSKLSLIVAVGLRPRSSHTLSICVRCTRLGSIAIELVADSQLQAGSREDMSGRVQISPRVQTLFNTVPRPLASFASPIRTLAVFPFTIAHKLPACTTERRWHVIASTDMISSIVQLATSAVPRNLLAAPSEYRPATSTHLQSSSHARLYRNGIPSIRATPPFEIPAHAASPSLDITHRAPALSSAGCAGPGPHSRPSRMDLMECPADEVRKPLE
ncbi:hypothetical protein C8F01DRAFT_1365611 [Mycena amicta]|nr:hypothetical protein C8F01DRAFT_1365611 [Mycena amicta]